MAPCRTTTAMLILLLAAGWHGPTLASPTLDPAVERFLARPWPALNARVVPRGFRVIALSHLAEYCLNLRRAGKLSAGGARRCLGRLVRLALDPRLSPLGRRSLTRGRLGHHGLYLTHLNVILGCHRLATGSRQHAALARRISRHLARRSLADPRRHAASYPRGGRRWPADQAATLYSLALHDQASGGQLSRAPVAAWLAYLDRHGQSRWPGLPRSEVSGRSRHGHLPRGCALSWTVRYMAGFAPIRARQLWARYKGSFLVSAGPLVGFREWPPGVRRRADADSGPIIEGIGAAATGLALGASRVVQDQAIYQRLRATRWLVLAAGGAKMRRLDAGILSRAIQLQAEIWRPR